MDIPTHIAERLADAARAERKAARAAKKKTRSVKTPENTRGVGKPGYKAGSRKTSPVPGMSRTRAAINSLTSAGRAENVGRISAVVSDEEWRKVQQKGGSTRIGSLAKVARGASGLGGIMGKLRK